MKFAKDDPIVAQDSIEEVTERQASKNQEMSKAIEDIERSIPSIQFGLRGKEPRKAMSIPNFDFGDDATIDPNGDDFGGLGRNGDGEYYDSFELEDRRCGGCGNEYDEYQEWTCCKFCGGGMSDMEDEMSDLI